MDSVTIVYQQPRGWSFNLYHNTDNPDMFQSYEDLWNNIDYIPLYSFVVVNNMNNMQEHGNLYQKVLKEGLGAVLELKGNLVANIKTFDDIIIADTETTLYNYLDNIYSQLKQI